MSPLDFITLIIFSVLHKITSLKRASGTGTLLEHYRFGNIDASLRRLDFWPAASRLRGTPLEMKDVWTDGQGKPDKPGDGEEEWLRSVANYDWSRETCKPRGRDCRISWAKRDFPWLHQSGAQRQPQCFHQKWGTEYLISGVWISFPTGEHLKCFHVSTIDPGASEGQTTCVGRELRLYLYQIHSGDWRDASL